MPDQVIEKQEEQQESVLTEEEQKLIEEEGAPEGYDGAPDPSLEEPKDDEEKEPEEQPKEQDKPDQEEDQGADKGEEETPDDKDEPDVFDKLETELAKPEGQENLTDFSSREKAYFWQMRRDRKSRQQAEADRDAALFREIQRKESEKDKKKEEKADPLDEIFKDKDPTDFLTVQEVREAMKASQAKAPEEKDGDKTDTKDVMQERYLGMLEEKTRTAHDDYDIVISMAPEIIHPNPDYVNKIGQALEKGDNPAEVAYELIKADPEFAKLFPVAETKWKASQRAAEKPDTKDEKSQEDLKKEKEAREKEEALKKTRTKTTGNISGGEETPPGEKSMQEIASMSDQEFAALPKATRDKYLKMYG